ncbi:hypothetical protein INT48_002670 [Thamnidium elegans]|uniref:Kinetochore protein Sos7 coiled-coil domain-containing protein n=1 Tax=Thamnidium elegans TaxID=101142 RepID=A0A8H7VZ81_9FUNG|nr:hypothetical protein INT48_002670 [Thamnidium elegans]
MQELNRPQCVEDLSNKIQELKQARLNLIQRKKPHPNQLLDLKKQFNTNLRENFINHYAKSKFLQCILQEPPVLITDNILHEIEQTNQNKQNMMEIYTSEIDKLKNKIQEIEQQITQDSKKRVRVEQVLKDILTQEAEVKKIKLELSGQGETVEECKDILARQVSDVETISKIVDERQEQVEDYIWKNHKTQKSKEGLKKKVDEKTNKAEVIKKLNTERDESTEKEYYIYKNAIDTIKKLVGIESIEHESHSLLHITCKKAVIHVHIDLLKNKISDASEHK